MPLFSPRREAILASSNHLLRQPAIEFIRRNVGSTDLVVIAAGKPAADDLAYYAVESVIIGLHRFDLQQFAIEIAGSRLAALGLARGELIALEAICSSISVEAAQSGELQLLRNVVRMPRFAKALCRTLTELRLEGITAEELDKADRHDLAVLLRRYTRALEERKIVDLANTFEIASEIVDHGQHPLSGAAVLLLCPSMRNRAERRLLRSVVFRATALLALGAPYEGANLEAVTGIRPRILPAPSDSCAASIQTHLFSSADVPRLDQDGSFRDLLRSRRISGMRGNRPQGTGARPRRCTLRQDGRVTAFSGDLSAGARGSSHPSRYPGVVLRWGTSAAPRRARIAHASRVRPV